MAVNRRRSAAVPRPKVRVPPTPRGLVGGDRLAALLPGARIDDDAPEPPVTLVCAPAGYGKTTLVSWWAGRRGCGPGAEPVAWADLDADDNTPFALWSTILAAIVGSGAATEAPALERLRPPRGPIPPTFLASVIDAVDRLPFCCWLVLDNLQEVRDPDTLRSLDMLVRRRPERLRLVLLSRFDPPLSLHRLRLEGRVREIRTPQLVFDRAETAAVLADHGVSLPHRDLDVVVARTEGWPTGVRLAALALANAANPGDALAHFAEDDHAVADYLVGEVLRDLRPDLVRFLLLTSVCDRFSPELAAALTGREDAAEVIDSLERGNVLLTRCGADEAWFRYHELLHAYLQTALHRAQPAEIRRLHLVAADWFAQHDEPSAALHHAAESQDHELIGRLLGSQGLILLMNGETAALRRLADGLPPTVTGLPQAAHILALADLTANDVAAADARLAGMPSLLRNDVAALKVTTERAPAEGDCAEARFPAGGAIGTVATVGRPTRENEAIDSSCALATGSRERAKSQQALPSLSDEDDRVTALRAVVELYRARLTTGLEPALARLTELRPDRLDDPDLALVALAGLGIARFTLGRDDTAEQNLSDALAAASAAHRDYLTLECLSHLAAVSLGRGDYVQTRERAEAALDFASERGWVRHHAAVWAHVAAAWAAHQSLDFDAEQHLSSMTMEVLSERIEPTVELAARSIAAVVAVDRGHEPLDALTALHARLTRLTDGVAVHPSVVAESSLIAVRTALRAGEFAWAREAVQRACARLGDNGDVLLLRAMVHIQHGRIGAARAALGSVTSGRAPSHAVGSVIEAHLMSAVLAEQCGEHRPARMALRDALDLAARCGALRPFFDGGPAVRTLVAANAGRVGRLDTVAEDLLARIPVEPPTMAGSLTPRERALLVELPSVRTTGEIAQDMFLSVNTVKTHLRSVYRKLGVSCRREAVVAARCRGLL